MGRQREAQLEDATEGRPKGRVGWLSSMVPISPAGRALPPKGERPARQSAS